MSHVPRFSFFSPYSRSYTVHFSFSTLLSGSCLILGYTMFVTHLLPFVCLIDFSAYSRSYSVFFFFFFSCFSMFLLHISCFKVCVSHFPRFFNFLAKFQSYSVHFSFLTFFTVSCHIPRPTMCVSHFPRFSVFWP